MISKVEISENILNRIVFKLESQHKPITEENIKAMFEESKKANRYNNYFKEG